MRDLPVRLFEAIVQANHRALGGDRSAGIRAADFAQALPVVALTCVDPRLNPLMPEVLGIAEEHFIWLRNAGNIITGPTSSTVRSLALACAIKDGREIAVIGHTDCQAGKTSVLQLTERFRERGVDRAALPDNLNEFFGLFASERQNVMRGVDFVRRSPLIGPGVPVHGLIVDTHSGRLEWLVNGYDALTQLTSQASTHVNPARSGPPEALASLPEFNVGEMKFPAGKIGDQAVSAQAWLSQVAVVKPVPPDPPKKVQSQVGQPPMIPLPPRIPARLQPRKPLKTKRRR